MANIPELFGSLVFNETQMQARLPKDVYEALKRTIEDGEALDLNVANQVASAMKDWAVEHGATHYTHWFQPMTGITAEKHDSFIVPTGDGKVLMEFSGKELTKGEPDASSFPSGGLRSTFEARGYTSWDPTSYAFIKDGSLCIPTAFYSYSGEVLDKKTPLLRSMKVISHQAGRIVKLFGEDLDATVTTTVGAEQEYFLIDKEMYEKRPDLIFTGRTLFGCKPPKGQELEDHYFGAIKTRVSAYMKELDEELWKLGVLAKTKHNEAAPSQHELAPIFATTNIATDHNQLTMEVMKKVAERHNLVCLLHEKPFLGVNGSGKHNNWSISTNTGVNLLNPGKYPENNLRFLLFLVAVIKAVDSHQDLLRISAASAGNDHRLGASEAPPAIMSIFLGDELTAILEAIETDTPYHKIKKEKMDGGVDVLPQFRKDTTDRNRTSPFAFTGNKFEFRMLGSAFSISCSNIILNTIVADVLCDFADRLETSSDFENDVMKIIKETVQNHKRIIFNGNNYSDEWVEEAQKRGLLNLKTTPEALPHYISDENIALFGKHKIYNRTEMESRCEVLLDSYSKVINIEALTMLEMVRKEILPACSRFASDLCVSIQNKAATVGAGAYEMELAKKVTVLTDELYHTVNRLDENLQGVKQLTDGAKIAQYYCDNVLSVMNEAREIADQLEEVTDKTYWPYPSYGDLLFSV